MNGKVRTLDEFLKNQHQRKTKSLTLHEFHNFLLEGVIARTDINSGIPYLDELTHHLIVVSMASLKFNSPEVTLAALIHDYLKPLFDIRWNPKKNRWDWYHFITNESMYYGLLQEFDRSINLEQVALISKWHHNKKNCNEICQIENSGLISSLETSNIFNQAKVTGEFLKSQKFRIPGKYRMFLLSLIRKTAVEILSRKYSERLFEILRVKRVRYEYLPIKGAVKAEDIERQILNSDQWRVTVEGSTLVIPLPSKFHEEKFYFEFNEQPNIEMEFDQKSKRIKGVKIPLGRALSTIYFIGTRDAFFVYADAGFELSWGEVIDETLAELGVETDNLSKIRNSLLGEFQADETCIFCGEPGEPIHQSDKAKSVLGDRFTDGALLLYLGKVMCPACKVGFEVEERLRSKGINAFIPYTAILEEVSAIQEIPIFKEHIFAQSVSTRIWLEILSEVYYALHKTPGIEKLSQRNKPPVEYYLAPKVAFYPYMASLIPLLISISTRYRNKKFVLQSGLRSGIVLPGTEKDLTPDEFRILRKHYTFQKEKGVYILRKLKSIYSIQFGLPNVNPPRRVD